MPQPPANRVFQDMATYRPQQGPFSDMINTPLQPRPIDRVDTAFSGHEGTGTSIGKLGLSLLQGIRQGRVASFLEQEKNNQTALDTYWKSVVARAQDPDLTEQGRQAVWQEGLKTLADHTRYELRDSDRKGVGGVLMNILDMASGGPIKQRQPIDFDAATGRITNLAGAHSQSANFEAAVKKAEAIRQQLAAQNGGTISKEAEQQALLPVLYELQRTAPRFAESFASTMGFGRPGMGTWAYASNELARTVPQGQGAAQPPATSTPPQMPSELSNLSPEAQQVVQEHLGMVIPSAPAAAEFRPAEFSSAAPAPGGIEYEPGYGPQRLAALSGAMGYRDSPIQVKPSALVSAGGKRIMATEVIGSPNPLDNGFWDVRTGQKIKSQVTRESIEGASLFEDEQGYLRYLDTSSGQIKYAVDQDGQRVKRGHPPVAAFNPATGRVEYATRTDALGRQTGSQGLQSQEFAEAQRKQRADKITSAGVARDTRKAEINMRMTGAANAANSGQIEIATQTITGLGGVVDPGIIRQAMTNVRPFLAEIERQRQAMLAEADASYQRQMDDINRYYPEVPVATAPPPAAAPGTTAPPKPQGGPAVPVPSAAAFDGMFKR